MAHDAGNEHWEKKVKKVNCDPQILGMNRNSVIQTFFNLFHNYKDINI